MSRQAPCVDGSCPFGREGPLGCHHVTYVSLAMAKQLPPWRVVLCMPQSQRFSYICRLILLQLASLAM